MKQIHLAVKKALLLMGLAALVAGAPAAFGEGAALPFGGSGVVVSDDGAAPDDVERLKKMSSVVDDLSKRIDEMAKMVDALAKTVGNSPSPASTSPAAQSSGNGSYTVVSGDSLWKIASRYLGDGSRYWDLVEANKAKYPSLAKNPNLIYPGWQFVIPGASGTVASGRTTSGSPSPTSNSFTANPGVAAPATGAKGGKVLYAWLQRAGLSGEQLKTAWAVGMAESGGNPRAFNGNANTGDKSYGLFQINMLGYLGPARLKQYNLQSNEELFDPEVNIRVMIKMSNNCTNWQPWSAYKNGSHRKFLSQFPP